MTATYAYDTRDRCTAVDHNGATLANYAWLGSAMASRDTTCDYPGGTKPKFRAAFDRDGLMRVTRLATTHQTLDQATSGYNDLGTWDYSYDAGSNELTMAQAGSPGFLEASAEHSYDTADRLITTVNTDTQTWSAAAAENSWYTYDDLGNRISHVHRDAGAIGYGHDKANRMTTLAGLSQGYDDAGNLTLAYSADRGTSYVYRYDHHNRLTGVYDSTNTTRKAAFGWDALGRRVEYADDVTGVTNRYYFDGVNELVEDNPGGTRQRYYVHGVSYVDERLMMYHDDHQRPYYYTVDRMYNVRAIVDRAGAIVERYAYDGYGRPYIRESAGRGDMNNDTELDSVDHNRVMDARSGAIWDPRADLDDDGDSDADDADLFDLKQPSWNTREAGPLATVSQAFSDVDNRYAFQGVPHFVMDTLANATAATAKLILGHHRARITQPPEGRWNTKDPLYYSSIVLQPWGPTELRQFHWHWKGRQNAETIRTIQDRHGDKAVCHYLYADSRPTMMKDPAGLFSIPPILPVLCWCNSQPWNVKCFGGCGVFYAPPLPPPPDTPQPGEPCGYGPGHVVCAFGSCGEKQCVCQCAGNSPGMNCTRGCLQCASDNGAPLELSTEMACKNSCNLTINENNRLNCCLQNDYNLGGCNCTGLFCQQPPLNPNSGNTTCTSMPIP